MAVKKMKRKGVFFTFIAIGLVSLLVYSFVIHTGYIYRDSMFVIETRVNTIEDFMKDVEQDINRGFYISSFRAILALQDYMITNNSFYPDIDTVFEEALMNATILNQSNGFLVNASFPDWVAKIKTEASKIDINFDLESSNIVINQTSPWTINVEMDIFYNVTDRKKTASWIKNEHIKTSLDVVGFEDPTYSLNTYGKVTNMIEMANQTNFNDLNVLKEHIANSYYIESNTSPSFLMRLEGNLSNSTMGIESIVNLDKLLIQGLGIKDESTVDYIYFSNLSISSCIINETINQSGYEWFRLDNDNSLHLDKYQVICT